MSEADQAFKHLAAGDQASERNLCRLRFSPNYQKAADEYQAAAGGFSNVGNHEKAVCAWKKFIENRRRKRDWFAAGRGCENLAGTFQTLEKTEEQCGALEQAAECYASEGKVDSCTRVWLKVADIREDKLKDFDGGRTAYEKCMEAYLTAGKEYGAAGVLKSYVGFLARFLKSHDEKSFPLLIEALERQMFMQNKLKQMDAFPKTCFCLVILRLYRDDPVAAMKDLDAGVTLDANLLQSDVYRTARNMVLAFDSGSQTQFKKIQNSSIVTFLPLEFAKLSRDLRLPVNQARRLPPDLWGELDDDTKTQRRKSRKSSSIKETPEDVAEMLV